MISPDAAGIDFNIQQPVLEPTHAQRTQAVKTRSHVGCFLIIHLQAGVQQQTMLHLHINAHHRLLHQNKQLDYAVLRTGHVVKSCKVFKISSAVLRTGHVSKLCKVFSPWMRQL